MRRMFEHLKIDIEHALSILPKDMVESIETCRECKFFERCDYDVESRYFRCPNRDLLERLEDLLL